MKLFSKRKKIDPRHELLFKIVGKANDFLENYDSLRHLVEKDNDKIKVVFNLDTDGLIKWIGDVGHFIEKETGEKFKPYKYNKDKGEWEDVTTPTP